MVAVKDIFDELSPDKDPFDEIKSTEETSIDKIRTDFMGLLEKYDTKDRKMGNAELTARVERLVKSELAKVKPVQNVIERHVPVHLEPRVIERTMPAQIIRETRVEVPAKDTRKLVEQKTIDELNAKIAELTKEIELTKGIAGSFGGSGVIGIPPPEGNPEDYVLTISKGRATWKVATGGSGGGTSPDAYTPTNVATTRTYDATNTSLDELSSVVGSLIASLQGAGIIQ